MGAKERPTKQTVVCEVCMKEVPLSTAKTAEAVDYVLHFCGLECHEVWRKKADHDQQDAADRD